MIRCIRLWTGNNGNSHFEEGVLDLKEGERGDGLTSSVDVTELSFRETRTGGSWEWHKDPVPRFVITLSGTLQFETRGGETFVIRPGDVLLAEDNTGTGHRWSLMDEDPWRRAYVVFRPGAQLPFRATPTPVSAEKSK